MATFFLDYEAGSDAADGLSFANRWKTITLGATAARIAPGDTIRVMGSPAPTSLGITATWTNKNVTVTLASALNALITNCDTAWTPSANVTATANTTTYRTSTGSASLAIAAGFTTGLAAFFATGLLNLSTYQGITLWVQVSAVLAASTLSIRLCSDVAGVTTVDTLSIPAITQINQWVPVYINKGSALGASIQSIALYGDLDPGTVTVLLDNISTVKAAGADALTLQSLIGKNVAGEYWWAIRGINGTAITIDSSPNMAVSITAQGYYGTTESVTTHKRETIKTDLVAATTTVVAAIQDSGTTGNLITFSGGWNRTDMSTQTLETFFDGQSGFGHGLSSNIKTFLKYDNLYLMRYYRGFVFDSATSNDNHGKIYAGHCTQSGAYFNGAGAFVIDEVHVWGCYSNGFENINGSDWTINIMKCTSCASATVSSGWSINSVASSGNWSITAWSVFNSVFYGIVFQGGSAPSLVKVTTLTVSDNGQAGFRQASPLNEWEIGALVATGNGASGAHIGLTAGKIRVGTLTATGNTGNGLRLDPLAVGADVTINSLVTSGNSVAGVVVTSLQGVCRILKSSMAEATKVAMTSSTVGNGYVSFQNYNLTAGDHRTYLIGGGGAGLGVGTIFSEATVRKTASGVAWKFSPMSTAFITPTSPLTLSLAKIACKASTLVTAKLWMRRTNTGITGTLRCRGGQINGVPADVTASISAAIDTWQEVTITFTPTQVGVVEIEVLCYGGTTFILYIDDMTITQV